MNKMRETLINTINNAIETRTNLKIERLGSIGLLEDALKETGYSFVLDNDTNGWEVDFWGNIIDYQHNNIAEVDGSMYFGNLNIKFNERI